MYRKEDTMELRIYKSELEDLKKIKNILNRDGKYKFVGKLEREVKYDTYFELYMENRDKGIPKWIDEVSKLFEFDLEDYSPKQFNGIIIAQTQESIYLVPKGYAYHIVEKMADFNFGMEIAERKIASSRIKLKSSHFLLQNKIGEVSNYKEKLSDPPKASESIISISGKLSGTDEEIFGKTIECSYSLSLSKIFNIDNNDPNNNLEDFFDIFNQIDIASKKNKIADYPRINYIDRDSETEKILDIKLLNSLLQQTLTEKVFFDLNRIYLLGSRINITSVDDNLSMYIKNKLKTEEEVEISDDSISEFVIKNKEDIKTLSDIRCRLSNPSTSELNVRIPLKGILFAEVEYEGRVYLLSNGKWGYLTKSFFEYLDKKLDDLDEKVVISEELDAPLEILEENGKLKEDKYIDHLNKIDGNVVLHKKFMKVDGIDIEIADIFDVNSGELYAIKVGTDTANSLYSFDQAILGSHVILNPEEFKVKETLREYQEDKLSLDVISEVIECRKMNVLWVADGSVNYVHEGISTKKFKLKYFKSFLLKLKIIDWFEYVENSGFIPKIYFSKSILN